VDRTEIALRSENDKFVAFYRISRVDLMVEGYCTDVIFMPPMRPLTRGREAAYQYWLAALERGVRDLTFDIFHVVRDHWFPTELGFFSMIRPDTSKGTVVVRGKYSVVWKQENGVLKRYVDIWNLDGEPIGWAPR
jgi:ketosteroid isomerase-like protein